MTLLNAAAWVALGFTGLIGLIILIRIWTGQININRVISEPNGDASLSRLQFLIFTVVIATSFFLVVASAKSFPSDIPQGVFMLLGISGSSYLVSKSIQFSQPEGIEERDTEVMIAPDDPTVKAGGTIQFSAAVKRAATQSVTWSAAHGKIDAKGLYTAPASAGTDTVDAASTADPGASGTVTVTIT